MKSFILLIILVNLSKAKIISDDNYRLLPPIFHIDNYEACLEKGKLFCRISIKLSPYKDPSKAWEIIKKTKNNENYYNHDELFHAVCLENFARNFSDILKIRVNLEKTYSAKYESLELKASITEIDCKNYDNIYEIHKLDIIILFLLSVYVMFVIFVTFLDFLFKSLNKYLIIFSLRHNWRRIIDSNLKNLKFIEGIRFYNTLLIIFCHTFFSFASGYVSNTKYLEDLPQNPVKHFIRILFAFLVQTFFLISAWLLSFHIFQVVKKKSKPDLKFIFLTLLNRYLRIIVPVSLMVGLACSVCLFKLFRGPVKNLYSDKEYETCQRYWWTTLLLVNNHFERKDMCYLTSWYLSADTQLYAISLIVLAIIWKFKHYIKTIIFVFILIGVLIPTILSYIQNLDVVYRIIPENIKNNMNNSPDFNLIYTSTYTNMATYMLGIGFGYIYFKNYNIFRNKKMSTFVWICFMGFPIATILISTYKYKGMVQAILSGILKPMYAFGIGIGILGMSQRRDCFVRKVCEWKPAIFLGNFTYSTYVVHLGIVFCRTAIVKQPVFVSDLLLVTSFVQDVIISFFCGFLMHILVELPMLQLQKMVVPQKRFPERKTEL